MNPPPPPALKWQFPPTHGGPAQGFNDSGKEFFTADVMEHVVREIIQNSLDAKDQRYPDSPVVVTMSRFDLARGAINAADLTGHISESLKSTREKKNERGVRFYESALKILKKPRISVLKVVDENTTGLGGMRWNSLVHEEGTTSKDSAAAGGSFGIGKNAPYAASTLGLVCYSTRYPNRYRVEKFIARCKLVAHQDPSDRMVKLQHVGFGTSGEYDGSNYPPVLGADIHKSFRLEKTGTGIFIMGFKEERGWQKAVVRSIARNFFAAIHDRKLSVVVESTEITNETLDECFGEDSQKQYYDLYRNSEQPITVEGDGGWKLHLKIATGDEKMDNRVAYVNRRGMLITAERGFSRNPFGARTDMGKYVAIVWAADDATDVMVREMEPPTHESIEYKRIEDPDKRKKIVEQLHDVSDKIRNHIRRKLDRETFEQKTELRELSDIIPYVLDPDKDNDGDDDDYSTSSRLRQSIEIRKIRTGIGVIRADEPEEEGGGGTKPGGGKGGKGGKTPNDSTPKTKKTVSNMRNIRVVRHGDDALRVAFDTKTGANKFVIKPVGEEYKDESPIAVTAAGGVSGAKSVEMLDKNTIRVNAEPDSRVVLDVSPDGLSEYTGYTILEYRARRTAR